MLQKIQQNLLDLLSKVSYVFFLKIFLKTSSVVAKVAVISNTNSVNKDIYKPVMWTVMHLWLNCMYAS